MYRVTVTDAHPTDQDRITLDCIIEHSTDGGQTWATLPGAPTALPLPLSSVIGALKTPGDDTEKRAALTELIRTAARGLPAVQGSVAIATLEALLPQGWPITVSL